MLRLLRPKQWTKNLLLFAALVFAEELFHPAAFVTACLAFVAFCAASSSIYVVNDLVDVERDRLHPDKRRRPIASRLFNSKSKRHKVPYVLNGPDHGRCQIRGPANRTERRFQARLCRIAPAVGRSPDASYRDSCFFTLGQSGGCMTEVTP